MNALSSLLNSLGESDPIPAEVVTFVESNIGKPVNILHTAYKGVIHSCNKSQRGFYPGVCYPVYVKITDVGVEYANKLTTALGDIFEYGLEQIEFID